MVRLSHPNLEIAVLDWYNGKPAAALKINTEGMPSLKLSEVVLEALRDFYDHTRGQNYVRADPDREKFKNENRIHYNFWVAPVKRAGREALYGRVEMIQGSMPHYKSDEDFASNLSTSYPAHKFTLIFNTKKSGKYSQEASFEDRDDFIRFFNLKV